MPTPSTEPQNSRPFMVISVLIMALALALIGVHIGTSVMRRPHMSPAGIEGEHPGPVDPPPPSRSGGRNG